MNIVRLEAGEGVLRRGESPVVPLVSVTSMVKICSCNLRRTTRGDFQVIDIIRGVGDI